MMETDQPAASENPEQQGDEQGGAAGASPVRSYECTFCKRGFSNAQALGGHMNIHRRDKAKLKQSSSSPTDNQQSFDIISKINFPSSYNYPNHPAMDAAATAARTSASQEIIRSSTPGQWPWVIQDEVDDVNKRSDKSSQHVGEIKQLPLFDEKPSTTDENYQTTAQVQEKGFSSSSRQSSSGSDQLDLELRLGPEPQDSSPTMTTKKFF